MSLRFKILFLVGMGFLVLLFGVYLFAKQTVLSSFVKAEQEAIVHQSLIVRAFLEHRINDIGGICHDWASWDDTYQFIVDQNPTYQKVNLLFSSIANLQINLVAYIHRSGKLVYGRWYDLEQKKISPLPADFVSTLLKLNSFTQTAPPDQSIQKGLLQSPWGLLLFVSRPILPSNEIGPSRGTLIFGRLFTEKEFQDLSLYKLEISILPLTKKVGTFAQNISPKLDEKSLPAFTEYLSKNTIAHYNLLRDWEGQPVAHLRILSERNIFLLGLLHANQMVLPVLLFGLIFSIIFIFALEHFVLARLVRLQRELKLISSQKDASLRVSATGNDELSALASCLNQTFDALQEAHQQLQESEMHYRALVETIPDWIWEIDENFVYTYVSPRVQEILGYSPEEMIGKTPWDFMPKEEVERLKPQLERLVQSHAPIQNLQLKRFKENGELVITETNGVPIFDSERRFRGYRGVARNITERKLLEDELATEKEWLRGTLRCLAEAVIAVDTEQQVIFLNETAEKLTGWREHEALGQQVEDILRLVHLDTREPFYSPFRQALENKKATELPEKILLITRQGTEHLIAGSVAPIFDQECFTIGAVIAFRDVTIQNQMEKEAYKAMRLEALSLLASGIAHDFNNLLGGIMNNVQLAELLPMNSAGQKQALQAAQIACQRAADLTQKLLTFAKGGEPIKKIIKLEPLVREHLELALAGSSVRLDLQVEEDLPLVEVDPTQIGQVVQNIVRNAVEAMPQGGCLYVAIKKCPLGRLCPACHQGGPHVTISFRDEGCGIPAEHLQRIFEPYFTTKQKGSGLGLAIVHSIITRHKGNISASSKIGQGATFTICLPCIDSIVEAEVQTLEESAPASRELLKGSGRLLIMEDESTLREVTQLTLQQLGYEVWAVEDGASAIYAFQQAQKSGRPFDLVILDLTVRGGMGGLETMRQLQKLDPQVRAIICSGYSTDDIIQNYREYGFQAYISKPYNIWKLAEVVRNVLSDSESTRENAVS